MLEADPFDDGTAAPTRPPGRTRRWLTIGVLVALVVAMVFLAYTSGRGVVSVPPPAPAATPAPSPVDARLAIVDADGRLTTTDADGGAVTALGGPGDSFAFPAWSPDGSHLATIGRSGSTGAIEVFGIGPTGAQAADPVTLYGSDDRPPFYLAWSPDGSHVTFLTTEPDGIALRIAPADGSTAARSIHDGAPLYWAWAANDRLLVHSGLDAAGFLGDIGLDGAVVDGPRVDIAGFRVPAITTGGAYRGYVAPGDGTPMEVVVEASDGTSRQSVGVFGAAAIGFGPAGDLLAFIAPDRDGRQVTLPVGPLRVLDGPSGDVRTLLPGPVVAFFWSPDGRTIAALQIVAPVDDTVATTAGSRSVLARAVATARPPKPTAADTGLQLGLVFVDVATLAIHAQRVVRLADTFTLQVLPYFDQYAVSHRIWSPDGSSVVLPLVGDDDASRIVVIPADGTEPREIAPGVAAFWGP